MSRETGKFCYYQTWVGEYYKKERRVANAIENSKNVTTEVYVGFSKKQTNRKHQQIKVVNLQEHFWKL